MSNWPRCILGMVIALLMISCRSSQQDVLTGVPTQPEPDVTVEQATEEAGPTYDLRQSDVEEYLSAIPAIITRMENQHADNHDIYQLEITILDDLWILYGDQLDTASYDQLTEVAPYLLPLMPPGPLYGGWAHQKLNEEDWHTFVVNAWLRDNQPDLETDSQWTFGQYTLNLEAVDFNGDGINEFSVELIYKSDEEYQKYREYFIWQRDANLPEGYSSLPDTSFVYNNRQAYYDEIDWGVFDIEDVTGDGLPEWMISGGDCLYGTCSTQLVIYGWRNGAMQQLSPERLYLSFEFDRDRPSAPPPGTWTFTNLDDDPPLELIQEERFDYPCEFSATMIYDWDENVMLAAPGEKTYNYADSPWCSFRYAHLAMADHDFAATITHYEKVLSFEPVDEVEVEAWQYARLRLATAYALNGQGAQAASLLSQLEAETATSPVMEEMINNAVSAFAERQNPLQLCATLFTTISVYPAWDAADTHILTYGAINDYHVSMIYGGGDYSPAHTGCDIHGLWNDTVESLLDDSPLNMREQIEAQGWLIGGELWVDVNHDEVDEWLLWTDGLPLERVLRWSDEDGFHYDQLGSTRYTSGFDIQFDDMLFDTIEVPGTSDLAIVHNYYNPSLPCSPDDLLAMSPPTRPKWIIIPGEFFVWRINRGEVEEIAHRVTCGPQDLEELTSVPGELHISPRAIGDTENGIAEILYWDKESGQFVDQSRLQTTPEAPPEEDSEPLDCVGSVYGVCISDEEPDKSLQMINAALSDPPEDATAEFFAAMHYLRASMFEQLGDEEAALAEYVQLYEEAPESAWGMLARLHLEISEVK